MRNLNYKLTLPDGTSKWIKIPFDGDVRAADVELRAKFKEMTGRDMDSSSNHELHNLGYRLFYDRDGE